MSKISRSLKLLDKFGSGALRVSFNDGKYEALYAC